MKSLVTVSVLISALVFSGCSVKHSDALLGTWQTGAILSEWGSNRITVTYRADGRVVGTNDFISGGALGWEGTYRVRGSVIQRTVKGRTEEITYNIEGDTMHQKIGDEDYTFTRMNTELGGAANAASPHR